MLQDQTLATRTTSTKPIEGVQPIEGGGARVVTQPIQRDVSVQTDGRKAATQQFKEYQQFMGQCKGCNQANLQSSIKQES